MSHISSVKNNLIISRALIKYRYSGFFLEILEYCDKSLFIAKRAILFGFIKSSLQHRKIAGSSLGVKRSEQTKAAYLEELTLKKRKF
jgi:hypothetical protein